MPESLCLARNRERDDRNFGSHVVRQQAQQLRRSIRGLRREGFRYVYVLDTPEDVEAAGIRRAPSWTNRQHETGPFDIIGDVHGCFDRTGLTAGALGIPNHATVRRARRRRWLIRCAHPEGRRAIFVGDLVDRGPGVVNVLKLVMSMAADGTALVRRRKPRVQAGTQAEGPNVRRCPTDWRSRWSNWSWSRRNSGTRPRSSWTV